MDSWNSATLPRFVLASPAAVRGTVLVLTADRLVLGRGAACDLRVDDSHVSAEHAMLRCSGARTTVHDLGSTNGTLVNGARIAAPRVLRHGDMLRFGTVEARYEDPVVAAAPTADVPDVGSLDLGAGIAAALRAAPAGRHARLDIAGGPGEPLVDAAGRFSDQHIQQVIMAQANRLRQVAASGSRARRLAAIGFVVFALGTGIITGLLLRLATQVDGAVAAAAANPAAQPAVPSIFGPAVRGVPIGALGLAATVIGVVVMTVGIVPHLTGTSKRRCLPAQSPPGRPRAGGRPRALASVGSSARGGEDLRRRVPTAPEDPAASHAP